MMAGYEKKGLSKIKHIVPVAMIIFLVPIIVRLKVLTLSEPEINAWKGNSIHFDVFSYYKLVCLIFLTVMILIMFLIKLYKKTLKIKKLKLYIPMFAYLLLVIVSTMLSSYKQISILGFVERYEGLLAIISYILLTYMTINLTEEESSVKFLIFSLLFSALLIGTIGLMQYLGYNIFENHLIKSLIVPEKYSQYKSQVQFNVNKESSIYTTLYHYNYVGTYMSMLFPLSTVLFIFERNIKTKVLFGLISSLTFFNLIGSQSRAGLFAVVISIIFVSIMIRKLILKRWKILIVTLISLIAIVFTLGSVINNDFGKRALTMFQGISNNDKKESFELKDIKLNGREIAIDTSDKLFKVVLTDEGKMTFIGNNGENLSIIFNSEDNSINFNNKDYRDYKVVIKQIGDLPIISIIRKELSLNFTLQNNEFKYYDIKGKGNIVELKPVEKFGFEGKEKMGSARGYIWSRSIPLIKNTVIIGYGPDSFALVFPQYDYVGKFNAYRTVDVVVDKPHNMYLNTALSTGVISLLALLLVFAMYVYSSFKAYFNSSFQTAYEVYGLAIFGAVCSYITVGMFNDSVISVAPVFWIVLGVGISINHYLSIKGEILS
jgi:O-antigen ligase